MEQMAAYGGMILGVIAVIMLGSLLIGGLVLKFTVRLLQGYSPSYGKSLLVVFLATVVGFVVNIILSLAMGAGSNAAMMGGNEAAMAGVMAAQLGVMAISLLASLFITAFFVNLMIKAPDGQAIGYGRSCLVSLLYLVVMVVLVIGMSLVVGVVIGLLGAGMAGAAG